LTAAGALAALSACGGGGSDPNTPEFQAFMQRDATMAELGEAILPLNEMSNEEIPVDEAVFLDSARRIAAAAENARQGFDNETIVPESRAKPEIWANMADFEAKAADLQTAAAALLTAAKSGGFAAGRSLVAGVRDTCGACHRPYRGPEPE
jgi:cytochrome c556